MFFKLVINEKAAKTGILVYEKIAKNSENDFCDADRPQALFPAQNSCAFIN